MQRAAAGRRPRLADRYLEGFGGAEAGAAHRVVSCALRSELARERSHGVLINEDGQPYACGKHCVHGQLGLGGRFQGGRFQVRSDAAPLTVEHSKGCGL